MIAIIGWIAAGFIALVTGIVVVRVMARVVYEEKRRHLAEMMKTGQELEPLEPVRFKGKLN